MAGQRTIDDVIDGGQGGLANVCAGYYTTATPPSTPS
jgi:hypothetical protein